MHFVQWFGDLVTEVWWNNLWLAEGFATYLEMAASETVRPDMGFFDNFWLTEELVPALDYDDSGSSHPLTDTAGAYTGVTSRLHAGHSVVQVLYPARSQSHITISTYVLTPFPVGQHATGAYGIHRHAGRCNRCIDFAANAVQMQPYHDSCM